MHIKIKEEFLFQLGQQLLCLRNQLGVLAVGELEPQQQAEINLSLISFFDCTTHFQGSATGKNLTFPFFRARITVRLLPEASEVADESLKAEIQREIVKAIYVIPWAD